MWLLFTFLVWFTAASQANADNVYVTSFPVLNLEPTKCSNMTSSEDCNQANSCAWCGEECKSPKNNMHVYYFIGSLFTFLGAFFVVSTYLWFEKLQRHPASFIIGRCVFDLLFGGCFIVLFFSTNINKKCHIVTPILVSSLLGNNMYSIAASWNQMLNLKNPFKAETANVWLSHCIVWTVSLIAVGYLLSSEYLSVYRCDYQVCWVKIYGFVNLFLWISVYIPIVVGILYSWYVWYVTRMRLRDLSDTLKVRESLLKESQLYTLIYSGFWSLAGICYAYVFWSNNEGKLYSLLAILISLLGIVDAAVWVFRFRRKEDEDVKSISSVLRREVFEHIMFGIYMCLREAMMEKKREALPWDVQYVTDMHEDPKSTPVINSVESNRAQRSKRKICIKDYAPQVFRYIRENVCGLKDRSYERSIDALRKSKSRAEEEYKGLQTGGSGSFFFKTFDNKFIIKTIQYQEAKFLLQILKKYVTYLDKNRQSLISRILGMHSLHIYDLTLYFIVMENIFLANLDPQEQYDIKGSSVDRQTSNPTPKKPMKDNDLKLKKKRGLVILTKKQTEDLIAQLLKDSEFLAQLNIMDYSLLVGVYYIQIVTEQRACLKASSSDSSGIDKNTNVDSSFANKYGTGMSNYQTQKAKSVAGFTPEQGYLKLQDQITMIDTMIGNIWDENGGEMYSDVELLQEQESLEVQELQRLKNMYLKLIEDMNKLIAPEISASIWDAETRSISQSPRYDDLSPLNDEANIPEGASWLFAPVNDESKNHNPRNDWRGGVQARVTEGPGIYYMGIIDMLQEWNFRKRSEHFIKTKILRNNSKEISAVEPNWYQKRFMKRMREIIKDKDAYLKGNKVDEEWLKQKSFELVIWPPLKQVEDTEPWFTKTKSERLLRKGSVMPFERSLKPSITYPLHGDLPSGKRKRLFSKPLGLSGNKKKDNNNYHLMTEIPKDRESKGSAVLLLEKL